jgi:hypothetical protein
MRVMTLGLMGGDPSLVDVRSLAEGITRPATRTEQYEALRLTEWLWERFSEYERAMLAHRDAKGTASQEQPPRPDSREDPGQVRKLPSIGGRAVPATSPASA